MLCISPSERWLHPSLLFLPSCPMVRVCVGMCAWACVCACVCLSVSVCACMCVCLCVCVWEGSRETRPGATSWHHSPWSGSPSPWHDGQTFKGIGAILHIKPMKISHYRSCSGPLQGLGSFPRAPGFQGTQFENPCDKIHTLLCLAFEALCPLVPPCTPGLSSPWHTSLSPKWPLPQLPP